MNFAFLFSKFLDQFTILIRPIHKNDKKYGIIKSSNARKGVPNNEGSSIYTNS